MHNICDLTNSSIVKHQTIEPEYQLNAKMRRIEDNKVRKVQNENIANFNDEGCNT